MMLRDVLERYPVPTKEKRRAQIAKRATPAVTFPRDDGPAIRRLLKSFRPESTGPFNCSGEVCPGLAHKASEFAHPATCTIDRLRTRVAMLLGVTRELIERAERPNGGGFCFVQLPDDANDGRTMSPKDRLDFNLECPDVTRLPSAPLRRECVNGKR